MKTTLVNIQAHPRSKFDVWIGRSRRTHKDERVREHCEFTAPYYKHGGSEDWREGACKNYKRHLSAVLASPAKRKRFEALRGKRLGVWGEFGLLTGQVLLDMLKELKKDK